MEVTALADVDAEVLARIAATVGGFRLLEELVRWGFGASPRREIAEVVVQDEFSHDVVVPWDERLVLVFDST